MARSGDRLTFIFLALASAGAFVVMHPYRGISGDALIYVTREWAGRGAAALAGDMLFLHDTQTSFSVFGFLLRNLLRVLPVDQAAFAMASASMALWMIGAGFFCAALSKRSGAEKPFLLALVMSGFMAIVPLTYSTNNAFTAGEYLAVPRPFAEAFVLFMLAAMLTGRMVLAVLSLAMAFAFHPLVGLSGASVWFLFLAFGDRRFFWAGLIGLAAFLFGALLDLPLLGRLFLQPDAEWKSLLVERSAYLFLAQADASYWCDFAWRMCVIVLAGHFAGFTVRRFCLSLFAAGFTLVALSLLFVDLWTSLLFIHVQTWRIGWILAVAAPAIFPILLIKLWTADTRGRLVIVLLVLAFALRDAGWTSLLPLAGALFCALRFGPFDVQHKVLLAIGFVAGLVFALFTLFPSALVALSIFHAPLDLEPPLAQLWALRPLSLPAGLLLAFILLKKNVPGRAVTALSALVAVTAAFLLHDDRPKIEREIEAGRAMPELRAAFADGKGPVLWLHGGKETWYLLHRPNWASAIQGSSIAFSRALALGWRERVSFLIAEGLAPAALRTYQPMTGAPLKIAEGAMERLCAREDAPEAIVGGLLPGETPHAGAQIVQVALAPSALVVHERMVWPRPDRYAIWSCVRR